MPLGLYNAILDIPTNIMKEKAAVTIRAGPSNFDDSLGT
jgi:hypothetical protein